MIQYSAIELNIKSLTVEELVNNLNQNSKLFFLDSANNESHDFEIPQEQYLQEKSKYSFLGVNPIREFCYSNDNEEAIKVLKRLDEFLDIKINKLNVFVEPVDEELKQQLKPQFFFYASYNFGEKLQNIDNTSTDLIALPDVYCVLCADNFLINHHTSKIYYIYAGEEELDLFQLQYRVNMLTAASGADHLFKEEELVDAGDFESNFNLDEYLSAIDKIKNYIYDGHIYQVNLAQTFSFNFPGDYWDVYKKIRKSNPAPFCAFFKMGGMSILSTTPERFLYKKDGKVYTEPIKGTRPRGVTAEEDQINCQKLKTSEKERSENIMIVDLLRNDLGRICNYGTVEVEKLLYVEKYASVFQLISRVVGELKPELKFGDILEETFPGGSITGCPKLRAMEIIAEMEPSRRSLFTGTLGRISVDGETFDLSIVIRTILVSGQYAQISLGGGIVYDSSPVKEYQETIDKGAAIVKVFNLSREVEHDSSYR
ncbi:anthranilate synthase component I family protein [Paenibacillus rhizophilus]|nr:anthranilate synthase component I family protein [Paenibacillus rhizophilus]